MITVSDLTLAYSGQPLFSHVDLQFTKGNCYGIIGANGAGKSTFLKILSGQLEPTSGEVSILPKTRMSVLKQDQNAYNDYKRDGHGHYGQPAAVRRGQGEGRPL